MALLLIKIGHSDREEESVLEMDLKPHSNPCSLFAVEEKVKHERLGNSTRSASICFSELDLILEFTYCIK